MPVLASLGQELARERPLTGWTAILHLHLTAETLALGRALAAGGARPVFLPSNRNPSDPVVVQGARQAGLVLESLEDLGDLSPERAAPPFVVVEGNGGIFRRVHEPGPRPAAFDGVEGISMHTSSGGRLVDAADPARIRIPVVAVYRDLLKGELETGLGTSQSVLAALLRSLERPVAGRRAVIVGFGRVGRGVARGLRTLGARVQVAETGAEPRLLAHFEGFDLVDLAEALPAADLCVTTTGLPGILDAGLLACAREGLVLANVSDQPHEIDLRECLPHGPSGGILASWSAGGGPPFWVLAGGLQVNHVAEKGNPAELMDITFSIHALTVRWLVTRRPPAGVHSIPEDLRDRVTSLFVELWR